MTEAKSALDFNFIYAEVMREAAELVRAGKRPTRVRFSEMQWAEFSHTPEMQWLSDKTPAEQTFCGLPIRVDRDYHGPVAVETAEEGPSGQ